MTSFRTEGIVLHQIPYKDYDQIVTVLTHEHGLLGVMIFGANRPKSTMKTALFLQAEFMIKEGRNSLYLCEEISPINHHFALRENLSHLETASEFVKAIRTSQLAGKPIPALYKLLILYLQKLPKVEDHLTLAASFLVKILLHEGLLGFPNTCTTCGCFLTKHHLHIAESYCQHHAPPYSLSFSPDEISLLLSISQCQSFFQIFSYKFSSELYDKLKKLFHSLTSAGN